MLQCERNCTANTLTPHYRNHSIETKAFVMGETEVTWFSILQCVIAVKSSLSLNKELERTVSLLEKKEERSKL